MIAGAAAELGISAARLDHSVCTYLSNAAGGGSCRAGPSDLRVDLFICLSLGRREKRHPAAAANVILR